MGADKAELQEIWHCSSGFFCPCSVEVPPNCLDDRVLDALPMRCAGPVALFKDSLAAIPECTCCRLWETAGELAAQCWRTVPAKQAIRVFIQIVLIKIKEP